MKKLHVLDHFGGPVATARALGIKHSSVCGWNDVIPELQARRLAEITGGELKFDPALYEHTPVKKAS